MGVRKFLHVLRVSACNPFSTPLIFTHQLRLLAHNHEPLPSIKLHERRVPRVVRARNPLQHLGGENRDGKELLHVSEYGVELAGGGGEEEVLRDLELLGVGDFFDFLGEGLEAGEGGGKL